MKYFCCEERRREAVRKHGSLNGIDFLEVAEDQQSLTVLFLKPLTDTLTKDNFRIRGGERITAISVTDVTVEANGLLKLAVDRAGDFAGYTLHLTEVPSGRFDPLLSRVDFSFKAACPSDFDCREEEPCPPEPEARPALSYLAKDYASFRRLMLDRLSTLMPDWQESSPADVGVALVELLAYVGDHLSYRQDAVATEAYLDTARRRISVRRHARLVDYPMHDGCNARVWVQVRVDADEVRVSTGTPLFTRVPGHAARLQPGSAELDALHAQQPEPFETLHDATLFAAHHKMPFYTWGARECCLPRGATRATLKGGLPRLQAGDVLIFEEILGPRTGQSGDADPEHRHAVVLTHVEQTVDPAGGRFHTPPSDAPVEVTEIQWAEKDALPLPLCVSARKGGDHYEDVSVARGNIVLADHGRWIRNELLGTVPEPDPALTRVLPADDRCAGPRSVATPPRFRPALADQPLTRARPYTVQRLFGLPLTPQMETDLEGGLVPEAVTRGLAERGVGALSASPSVQGGPDSWSASDGVRAYRLRRETASGSLRLNVYRLPPPAADLMRRAPRDAEAVVTLVGRRAVESATWTPRRDLLASDDAAREFVAETESDGTTYLRFGDDRFGRRPESGTSFTADYRIGNGTHGNIGADSLGHVVSVETSILSVRNPLSASGGQDPEALEQVRQLAPYAFRRQQRAVTAADYAAIANRHPGVQRAAATLRWTGSWQTVFVTVDRLGGLVVDGAFEDELRRFLEPYRMVGHDLEIDDPRFVALEIELRLCVADGYYPGEIKSAVLERFSNRRLADGRRGVFHPDNFTFGQPVFLSRLYAEAQEVEGVTSARVVTFQRRESPGKEGLLQGKLEFGRLEIAQLDNDPSFPERGVLHLTAEASS